MTNAEEIQFGLNTVLSVVFGTGGALGVWFTLKGKVKLLEVHCQNLANDNSIAHERIDNLKEEVKANREKSDKSTEEIKKDIADMKLEIIKEIHKLSRG
jgi:hypothetical protein